MSEIIAGTGQSGLYNVQCFREGKLIWEETYDNLVVDEGLTHSLDVVYLSGTQITAWYLGIFSTNYTPAADDTAANISARAVEFTSYSEATRVAFAPGAISANALTNSANRATFTVTAAATIYGSFLVSNSAKNGTTGTLMSVAKFTNARPVISGDELLVTYTMTASDV